MTRLGCCRHTQRGLHPKFWKMGVLDTTTFDNAVRLGLQPHTKLLWGLLTFSGRFQSEDSVWIAVAIRGGGPLQLD